MSTSIWDPATPIVLASGNPHKLEEMNALLAGRLRFISLTEAAASRGVQITEPAEPGRTFEANAEIKAVSYARQLGMACLADDSGLEIDALDGRPGVISSHYCTDGQETGMTRAQRDTALALVRGIPGVREVIDAVEVGRTRDAARFLSDTQIEKEIDLRLLLARDVESINYSVQSVFGTVHLIGTARSRDERVRVGVLIRQVGGVRRLVDHVRVRGEARSLRHPAASP